MSDQAFLRSVRDKGEYLRSRIKSMNIPIVREVRGLGLMTGVEIDGNPRRICEKMLQCRTTYTFGGQKCVAFSAAADDYL